MGISEGPERPVLVIPLNVEETNTVPPSVGGANCPASDAGWVSWSKVLL